MGQVKSFTRKTKSGKTVKVKAHTRGSGSSTLRPKHGEYIGKGRTYDAGNEYMSPGIRKKRSKANVAARELDDYHKKDAAIREAGFAPGQFYRASPITQKRVLLKAVAKNPTLKWKDGNVSGSSPYAGVLAHTPGKGERSKKTGKSKSKTMWEGVDSKRKNVAPYQKNTNDKPLGKFKGYGKI